MTHSLESIHNRLRLIEVVLFISLVLNLISGYVAIQNHKQMNDVQQQTGVR